MTGNRKQSLASWSDLPEDLLRRVSTKLLMGDYLNFQLVCTTWNAAANQLSQCVNSPLLMLPHCCADDFRSFICPVSGRMYRINLPEFIRKCRCLDSFYGWLVMVDAYPSDTMLLYNPFTNARINLPRWDITKHISRVVLSSAPTDPKCVVMIFYSTDWGPKFCRVGDDEWTTENSLYEACIGNALMFKGKLYVLYWEKLGSSTWPSKISTIAHVRVEFLKMPHSHCYLVLDSHMIVSGEEMLLVVWIEKTDMKGQNLVESFAFFKLDLSTSSWVEMETIGNRVLFFGKCCYSSFDATELGCKENQIYYTNTAPGFFKKRSAWKVFNIEDGSIESADGEYLPVGEPLWITPSFV